MSGIIKCHLICCLCTICRFSSISSESGGPPERNEKSRERPPQNIDIATKWPSQDETLRNFPSITCLLSYSGSDDALYRLLSVHILISTSSLVIDRPKNLAADPQEPIIPQSNKEEMHKTRETFHQSLVYYQTQEVMMPCIVYCPSTYSSQPHLVLSTALKISQPTSKNQPCHNKTRKKYTKPAKLVFFIPPTTMAKRRC